MPKNIVVCLDGSGNQFAVDATNVLRLHGTLVSDPEQQVTFYSPGVGTFSPSIAWTRPGEAVRKTLGLALGFGYRQTIENAYWFIVENYREGDRIFLFGFSRGAYAARIVAALIHGVGLLQHGNRHLVQFALSEIELLRRQTLDFGHLGRFRKQFSQPFDSKPFVFLGVWDTVSSVSWAYDYLRYVFTASNPGVEVVRHAVSIDEHRAFFAQNLFKHRADQDMKEVWFSGVHADVGGGYCESQSGLAKIALQWMMVESRDVRGGGVLFHPARVRRILDADVKPNHRAPIHQSLTWKWWPAEFFPKQKFGSRLPMPHLFRRRDLVVRHTGDFFVPKCRLHQSVLDRMGDETLGYLPRNLPSSFEIEPDVGF